MLNKWMLSNPFSLAIIVSVLMYVNFIEDWASWEPAQLHTACWNFVQFKVLCV